MALKPSAPLFKSLQPDGSRLQQAAAAAAQGAEQRWPLFRAVAPHSSPPTEPLTPVEKSQWTSPGTPLKGLLQATKARKGLGNKLASSLQRISRPPSRPLVRPADDASDNTVDDAFLIDGVALDDVPTPAPVPSAKKAGLLGRTKAPAAAPAPAAPKTAAKPSAAEPKKAPRKAAASPAVEPDTITPTRPPEAAPPARDRASVKASAAAPTEPAPAPTPLKGLLRRMAQPAPAAAPAVAAPAPSRLSFLNRTAKR